MQVKMLTCQAGVDYVRNIGDVVDVDDAEGARLVDKGYAEATGPETATKKPKRTAAKPKAKERDTPVGDSAD